MATAAELRELRRKHGLGEFKKSASRINPKTGLSNRKKSTSPMRKKRAKTTRKPVLRKRRRRKSIGIGMTTRSKLSEWELVKDSRSAVLQFTGGRSTGGRRPSRPRGTGPSGRPRNIPRA